jgi:outer membrane protein TolC
VGAVAGTELCGSGHVQSLSTDTIDPQRPYRLEELIAIAESTNPKTREAWELAEQEADRLCISRSAYYPALAAMALFGDQRIVNPFPKPLAPRGYVMVETPETQPAISLEYVLFDFGRRAADLDRSKAQQLAAQAGLFHVNQEVAYRVVQGYYGLLAEEQHLDAARKILGTAQTTQEAAEAQLANGRATLPDVLNAKAATAQAAYDLEAAIGAERIARVTLRENLGVEPSDEIVIKKPDNTPLPNEVTRSIEQMVEAAQQDRPDLQRLAEELRASEAELRAAKAERRPSFQLEGNIAQTSLWPTADYGQLGAANQTTWSAGVKFQWSLFDGGQRSGEVALAESRRRQTQDELEEQREKVSREVWTAYLSFRTAVRQREASEALLQAAETSYNASLDAYQYGVKNLIDVVTAERQFAEARLASVQAYSSLWQNAANLEFATGNLLRRRTPLTTNSPARR